MLELLKDESHFRHVLAGLVLLSRLGDMGSTLIISPSLALEANPAVRRFSIPMLALGLAVVLLPYYHTGLAVAVLIASLLVTGHNLSRGWLAHALGEKEMSALFERAARRSTRARALGFTLGASGAVALAAAVLIVLSGQGVWGYWGAIGVLGYALGLALHGSLFMLRLFRRIESTPA